MRKQPILIFVALAASSYAQRSYTATPIQAPGFALSSLVWISDDGKTGYGSGLIISSSGATSTQCIRYQDGTFTAIPRNESLCAVAGANNRGQFVGAVAAQDGTLSAFLNDNGRYLAIGRLLPGQPAASVAQSINHAGDIAGFFYANPQTLSYTGLDGQQQTLVQYSNQYAFAILNRQVVQLSTLGGPETQAAAINSNGDVAGTSDLAGGTGAHAVVFPRAGGIVDLGTLGGYFSRSISINSSGQVAGESTLTQDPHDLTYHSFIYDGSEMKPIVVPGDDSHTASMNDAGEVVGVYRNGDPLDHPFYYVNGSAVDLNSLVPNPPSGMVLTTPQYINNQGQILVMGVLGQTSTQFLLTPLN